MAEDTNNSPGTRQRLIDAAGAFFAEHGFRDATVRDICTAAGANIAAVNYHFGDKEGLYAAVLRETHCAASAHYAADLEGDPGAGPEAQLAGFIHGFMRRLFDTGRPAWHSKLMAREMVEPSPVLDEMIRESFTPIWECLRAIVRALLGSEATDEAVRSCAASVMGQCLHYKHAGHVIRRLSPELSFTAADIERLALHISRFSLAGIAGVRAALEGGRP